MSVFSRLRTPGAVALAALVLATTAACDVFGEQAPPSPPVIDGYVTGLTVLGVGAATVETVDDHLPGGSTDGPTADLPATVTVVNGGSVQQSVTSDRAFSIVRIAVEELPAPSPTDVSATPGPSAPSPTPAGAPSRGYRQITLPQPSTQATLVVTIAQTLPSDQFVFWTALATADGVQGPPRAQQVEAVDVGGGQVQVSVSWDVDSDTDLHVVDPAGDETYYNNRSSASGGRLDLDSNADCDIDGIRNENVTWLQDAPAGRYTVRLDLFNACGVAATNYVVTIHVAGQATQVYTGTLTGEGDFGGRGDGVEVATFEVTAG